MQTFKLKTHNWRIITIVLIILPLLCFLSMFLIERPFGIYIFLGSPLILIITIQLLYFLSVKTIDVELSENSITAIWYSSFFQRNKKMEILFEDIEWCYYNIRAHGQSLTIGKKDSSRYALSSLSLLFNKNSDYINFVTTFYEKINQYNLRQEDKSNQIKTSYPFTFKELHKGFLIIPIFITYGFLFYLIAKIFGY